MRELVWRNLAVSVWLLIGFCMFNAVDLLNRSDVSNAAYGPFGARVLLWPIALGVIELALWLKSYRSGQSGARIMAASMGLVPLLRPVIGALIVSDLYGRPVDWFVWWSYLYVATSHLVLEVIGPAARL